MSGLDDTWKAAGEQLGSLADRFKAHYRDSEGEDDADDEVREALSTLSDAFERVVSAVGHAVKDPEVRDEAKKVASSVIDALAATFSQLGDEIRHLRPDGSKTVTEEENSGGDSE